MPNTNNTPVSREELEATVSYLMLEVFGIHKKYNSPAIHPRAMNDELDEAYHRAVGRLKNTIKAFADEVEKELEKKPDNPANSQHYCYNDAVDDFKLALKDLKEKWGIDG